MSECHGQQKCTYDPSQGVQAKGHLWDVSPFKQVSRLEYFRIWNSILLNGSLKSEIELMLLTMPVSFFRSSDNKRHDLKNNLTSFMSLGPIAWDALASFRKPSRFNGSNSSAKFSCFFQKLLFTSTADINFNRQLKTFHCNRMQQI